MSAFNPMPDQLQPDSGSPAADVMAPPDQAPPPPPQAAMPPSPDQGGPVPAPQVQQDNPNTHGWRAVLKGALSGLENHLKGAGEGLITGGIPGAVVGAVNPQMAKNALDYRRTEMAQGQQQQAAQIKFTNAEAANTAAEATYRDAMREQMPKELKLKSDQLNETTVKTLAGFGVAPEIIVPNTAEGPKAAAAQLMDKYGAVPALTYLHVGDALIGYDPQAMASNSAVLNQVNMLQKITGGPQYTPGSLKMAPAKAKLMDDAMHIFNPPPTGSDKAPDAISRYDGYIRKVKLWSDTDPDKTSTLAKLQDARKSLKDGLDAANAEKEKLGLIRGASSQGAKPTNATDANGNPVIVSGAEAIKNRMAPATSGAEFQKDYIKPAQDAETAFQMFNQAYADYKAGAKTGAPSMLALSQHLSTTFGNVKGSRITKDMIAEHLNARSISDKAVVAVQQFTNGDALSPGQWDAFRGLIGQARVQSWGKAIREGGARGFDIQGRVPSDLGGKGGAAPAQQFTHLSASGKFGWNGSKWVPTGK